MRIADMNWMQVRDHAAKDDRAVLPIGSTEQHAYLSLAVDSILAERVALEAAEPLGIPVLPVLAYGVTGFSMFSGSPTLQPETHGAVLRDILSSLHAQGFRRLLVANGHSGNKPDAALGWADAHDDAAVIWHEVWDGRPDELAAEIDPEYDHASWSENFPWTRIEGVDSPKGRKPRFTPPPVNTDAAWRDALGDGSFGGPYQLPDQDVLRVWNAAVEVLRERLASGWP
jgi:creatinine amidohydrolase